MGKNRRRVLLLNLLLDEASASTALCARSFVPVVMHHTHPVRPMREMRDSDGRITITVFGGVMPCFVVHRYRGFEENC